MPTGWYRANMDRWEQGFAALRKFRARDGHCLPPRRYVEGKFKLGQWVSVQRYLEDRVPAERKRFEVQATGRTLSRTDLP